jgi:hypothetical protein
MLCRAHVASKTTAFLVDLSRIDLLSFYGDTISTRAHSMPSRRCLLDHCTEERDTPPLIIQWIVRRNRATRGMTPWRIYTNEQGREPNQRYYMNM